MKRKIILLIILIFSLSKNVFAIDVCTTSEKNRLKELANNINFVAEINYETVEANEIKEEKFVSAFYDIKVINTSSELKIYYEIDGYKYEVKNNYIEDIEAGKTKFYIYAYTTNLCVDELIMTKTIELEELNIYYYYNKDKCQDYLDFEYCQEFHKNDLSFEEIDEKIDNYLNDDNSISNIVNSSNIIIYIAIIIGFISLIIVILIIKKKRRNAGDL